MRIGPLFKWFGSKWLSARHYPEPMHDTISEKYAGGAGYSLNHCEYKVVIWEDDPNLSKLWQWIIREANSSDVLDIPVGLDPGTDIRGLGLSIGQQLLLKHWQRTNNVGDCWIVSPWGHLPGQWTTNTRARVAEEIHAVKHWQFAQPDPEQPATHFIDPPYLYNYRYRSGLPPFDYRALVAFVESLHPESMAIVCEAKRKSDGEIPDYLPFVESHRSVTSRRKATQSHHSSEVVFIKCPGSPMTHGAT